MMLFARLVRLPNLLVVALTQSLIFYRLLLPAFERAGIKQQLSTVEFWLLVGACMLVTAAGYVVNDILDAASDNINRPEKKHIYQIGLPICNWLFIGLVLVGYFISLALSFSLAKTQLLWLYPLTVGLLTLYSRYIKPIPLAGNLLVAVFCAGVPALIALAELEGLQQLISKDPATVQILIIYSIFAFLATLLRELVKDMEDVKGDRVIGRKTLPILLGINKSRIIGVLLAILTLLAIISPTILEWPAFAQPAIMGCIGLLSIALCFFSLQLLRGKEARDFGRISTQLKLFLLAGLGLLVLI